MKMGKTGGFIPLLLAMMLIALAKPQMTQAQSPTEQYQIQKKDVALATGVGFVIPPLGASIAGDSHKGRAPSLAWGGSLLLEVIGAMSGSPGLVYLGSVGQLGSMFWGAASSNKIANENNRVLQQRLGLKVGMAPVNSGQKLQFGLQLKL